MAAPSVSDPLRRRHRQKLRISFENKVFLTALYAGGFSILVMLMLLARSALSTEIRWLVGCFAVCAWFAFAWSVREQVLHPLQTLSSLIGALREGDFSMRAHAASRPGSLGDVMHEL